MLIPVLASMAAAIAQPIGDPGAWISADDYPASALNSEAEGRVRVTLVIDETGAVVDCTIGLSSGYAELDALTCTLLRQRAHFSPARDFSGHPALSRHEQQVRWAIPREQLVSKGFRMTYNLNTDGQITACKVDEFGGHDPDLTCSPQGIENVARANLKFPLDHYAAISIWLAMEVDDAEIKLLKPDGVERHILSKARFTVSPEGIITQCVNDHAVQFRGRSADLCGGPVQVGHKEFDSAPNGNVRNLTVSFELAGVPR